MVPIHHSETKFFFFPLPPREVGHTTNGASQAAQIPRWVQYSVFEPTMIEQGQMKAFFDIGSLLVAMARFVPRIGGGRDGFQLTVFGMFFGGVLERAYHPTAARLAWPVDQIDYPLLGVK